MSDKDKKRKYLLFKKDDGRPDHLKPCAFFVSAEGCKNGRNCRFLHDVNPDQVQTVSTYVPTQIKAKAEIPPPPVEQSSAKQEHKKRRTNDPADEASYPSLKVASGEASIVTSRVASADDEIVKLRDQLLLQQKQFEDQLKLLNSKISTSQNTTANSSSNSFIHNFPSVPSNMTPFKSESTDSNKSKSQKKTEAPPAQTAPSVSFHNSVKRSAANALSDEDSSDDEKFLFSTVNQILESGRNDAINSAQKKSTAIQPVVNALPVKQNPPSIQKKPVTTPITPANQVHALPQPVSLPTTTATIELATTPAKTLPSSNPFLDPSAATRVLDTNSASKSVESSGSKNRKNVFAKPKQTGSVPGTKLDFSKIDYKSLNWNSLVAKTRGHGRFATDYALEIDHSWISAKSTNQGYPLLALDCEMCETADPVTGDRESTLIRVSVVNGYNPDEVLLDTLVTPLLPIVDLRTRIHGITEEQLASVKVTLRHVQATLLTLMNDQTIILGHSVYNDLKALHLNHGKCIDTAYLFPMDNESEHSRPSLKLVAEQLLCLAVPEPHDSIMDSKVALYAGAFALEVGCVTIKRSASTLEQPSLLVHRIPDYCTEEHIKSMVMAYTNVIPASVSPIVRGDANAPEPVGKATIFFTTQAHADLAFESILGQIKLDKKNRPQKRIYLQGGGHVYVRK